ncbi:hypothetical protein FRB90_003156, partial [Tulasnella sp. 427]
DTIIEVKDGKLSLKQKTLRWEDSTTALRELLAFADFLSASSAPNPLTAFPPEHLPLLGKLVIESDKTGAVLAKNVKKTIMKKCGAQDDKDAVDDPRLPLSTVNNAISEIASRVNYGIQDTPAAKSQFKTHYDGLDDEQKKSLLDKQKKNGASKDPSSSTAQPSVAKMKKEPAKVSPVKESKAEVKGTNESDQAPKKPNKQAQMMQSFFKSSNKPSTTEKSSKGPFVSDFERTFKAFLVKKDCYLAPVNYFRARSEAVPNAKGKAKAEVIVLDDDGDIEMSVDSPTKPPRRSTVAPLLNAETATAEDLLNNFLSSLSLSSLPPGRRRSRIANQQRPSGPNDLKPKSYSRINVRTVVTKLTNAEVTDDIKTVRDCEKLLRNRRTIPVKYLQFCDNLRPGYYGTWTKSSTFIGPRTPFSKDPVAFDYSYDSGEEWEEEPEDAEEVLSSAGSEEEEDVGSEEEDDWLVGDDEIEYEAGAVPEQHSRSISPSLSNGAKRKLEVEKEKEKESKKRRIVKALVPYSTGPHWEDSVGDCPDHLRNYRIQLLNDTPFPIDPFTFVSEDLTSSVQDNGAQEMPTRNAVGAKSTKPTTQDGFVIPALPPHLHPSSQINLPTPVPQSTDGQTTKAQGNAKPKQIKKPFPPQHLPQLLNLINGSTLTKLHLVEQLGQEFKAVKEVKKYAIDAALGEVAIRNGGVWAIKEEAWKRCGLVPPAAKL